MTFFFLLFPAYDNNVLDFVIGIAFVSSNNIVVFPIIGVALCGLILRPMLVLLWPQGERHCTCQKVQKSMVPLS